MQQTYKFILGWTLMIILLAAINKTKAGHNIIYYTLLLMILFILASEYRQIAPTLSSISTIGQLDRAQAQAGSQGASGSF